MQVETVDRVPDGLDEIACQSPLASFYQTRIWLECLAKSCPQWRFRCLVARSGQDMLGYLPYFVTRNRILRRCWSLPFGTYGGPVVVETGQVDKCLVERFARIGGETGVHEVGLVDFPGRVKGPGLSQETESTHVINLEPGFDAIWTGRFDKSKRWRARKAKREGITVVRATTTQEVEQYYRIYKKRVAEWRQPLVYPQSLFVDLVEAGKGSVSLLLAHADDELLGGFLNFCFGDTMILWLGLSKRHRSGSLANTFLYTSCIQHACEQGYKRYNLGGSLGKESLISFKQELGGDPYSYPILRWRSTPMRIAQAAKRLVKRTGG